MLLIIYLLNLNNKICSLENIFAIVVTFNPDIQVLRNQYYSLIDEVNSIIYVDNHSDNNEVFEFVNSLNSELIYLIANNENKGLGFAQNQGIKIANENNASHVLILDHDSVLKKNFVKKLLSAEARLLSQDIKVGALGPIYINEKTSEIYPITKYYGPFIKRVIPNDEYVEASFLISSGCLIRTDSIKEIGYMNEDLFVDYIDVEWSYRARSMGYKLFAVPSSKMSHTVGDRRISILGRTVSVHSPVRRYYLTRNSIHMLKMPYVALGYKIRELVFNVLRIIIFSIVSDERLKFLSLSIKGLYDGLRGIKGHLK